MQLPRRNHQKLRQVVLQGEVQDYRGKSNKHYYKLIGTNYFVSPENEVTVIIAGKPMKLRVVPENVQEKKEDKKDDNFCSRDK